MKWESDEAAIASSWNSEKHSDQTDLALKGRFFSKNK